MIHLRGYPGWRLLTLLLLMFSLAVSSNAATINDTQKDAKSFARSSETSPLCLTETPFATAWTPLTGLTSIASTDIVYLNLNNVLGSLNGLRNFVPTGNSIIVATIYSGNLNDGTDSSNGIYTFALGGNSIGTSTGNIHLNLNYVMDSLNGQMVASGTTIIAAMNYSGNLNDGTDSSNGIYTFATGTSIASVEVFNGAEANAQMTA